MVSMDKISHFAQQIGKTFHSEKVLLFGSFARDAETEDSDVDLLVVMKFTGKAHHIATRIRSKLKPDFPIDLLVRTPEQIRSRLDMGDCFIKEITQKGSVLYEAAHS
jgi:predicted nucleotidyltransferase